MKNHGLYTALFSLTNTISKVSFLVPLLSSEEFISGATFQSLSSIATPIPSQPSLFSLIVSLKEISNLVIKQVFLEELCEYILMLLLVFESSFRKVLSTWKTRCKYEKKGEGKDEKREE
jgi:hypothetical protein